MTESSPRIELLADRLSEAFGEPTLIPREVKALLWDIDAEGWERGVVWKGGPGTIPPPRGSNPYSDPPLALPTEPTWGIAVHRKFDKGWGFGRWHLEGDEFWQVTATAKFSWRAHNVVDFIECTPDQVARIEAAR